MRSQLFDLVQFFTLKTHIGTVVVRWPPISHTET